MPRILIVDDEEAIVWGLAKLARNLGHTVDTASSAEEGLRLVVEERPDLVLLDVRLPGIDGISAIEQFREHIGETPVIVMTAFGALDTAVSAIRSGAFEYLLKPFDLEEVHSAVERALCGDKRLSEPLETEPHGGMVGETLVMQALYKRIALVSASDANVLLHGESGVGKELAAKAIHRYSSRSSAPFIAVNAAALSQTIAESELFGHVSGAFTDAQKTRNGLLLQADGGTLFLNEIADIPLPLQVKLLRAIEQQEVLPVGSDTPIPMRFRVVAATHQDLQQCILGGSFRHDLYYRICAFEIALPPLRNRPEDIPRLAAYFAGKQSPPIEISDRAVAELGKQSWYGNVREFRNAIEHASVLARTGVIQPEHLPAPQPQLQPCKVAPGGHQATLAELTSQRAKELLSDPDCEGTVYDQYLQEVERPLLEHALEHFDNKYAPAARALGLHRTTLKRKLEQLPSKAPAAAPSSTERTKSD